MSLNWSGISNPQIDVLLDRSREVSSQGERKKLFSDLTKILQDELPMVFIVHPIEPKAFSPKVQGYEPIRSEEHTSELQSQSNLVCRLLLEKKNKEQTRMDSSTR